MELCMLWWLYCPCAAARSSESNKVMLTSVIQVHYVLIPAADVDAQGSPPLKTFDVYTATLQTAESHLSQDAHACGQIAVPAARENFTLTLTPSADTAECREYADASGNLLDSWAATHRCLRCPVLQSETRYKVSTLLQFYMLWLRPFRIDMYSLHV